MNKLYIYAALSYAASAVSLQAQVASFVEQHPTLEKDLHILLAQMEQPSTAGTENDSKIQDLKEHYGKELNFISALKKLKEDKNTIWKDIEARELENQQLKDQLQTVQDQKDSEIKNLQDQLNTANEEKDKAQKKHKKEKRENEDLQAENAKIKQEKESLQAQIDATCDRCPEGQGYIDEENCVCGECFEWQTIDGYVKKNEHRLFQSISSNNYFAGTNPNSKNVYYFEDAEEAGKKICQDMIECDSFTNLWYRSTHYMSENYFHAGGEINYDRSNYNNSNQKATTYVVTRKCVPEPFTTVKKPGTQQPLN